MSHSQSDDKVSASLINYLRRIPGNRSANYSMPLTRISGGYDTSIFRFQLHGVIEALSRELVLRVYPNREQGPRAVFEATVQNALSDQQHLVPAVHLVCTDVTIIDAPFIIMDCVPGETLLQLGEPASSRIMGETHGMLHNRDTDVVIATLAQRDIRQIFLGDMLERIEQAGQGFTWANELITWLFRYKPKESRLSICHGDFHKLNIMQENGEISGVLDWSNFAVLEAAFDVANTLISFSIVVKHLTSAGEFEPVDLDRVIRDYRHAYDSTRLLDIRNLDYYLVLRSSMILLLVALGHGKPFQDPLIISDLYDLINRITGLSPESLIPGI